MPKLPVNFASPNGDGGIELGARRVEHLDSVDRRTIREGDGELFTAVA
jgi:hypothetical protein